MSSNPIPSAGAGNATVSPDLDKVREVLSAKMELSEIRYAHVSILGEGSIGEVRSAEDTLLGREVAVKALKKRYRDNDETAKRFLKEARGTAQLEHPNIVPVHELGMNEEWGIYFTMKKIHGEDLKAILDGMDKSYYRNRYPLPRLLEIFLAICNGVAFAHSKGALHRDLKPANVMVGEYGETLILDWGLVKQMDAGDEPSLDDSRVRLEMDELDAGMQTMEGSVSGTPNYMAPEQAAGRVRDIGPRSDVYSLGAILYHMLAHAPPFERTQLRSLLENVKSGKFPPPRRRRPDLKIPRELEAICLKAMALAPLNRYASAEKLAEDVRSYLAFGETSAYKPTRPERFMKACKRRPVRTGVVAAALAVSLLGIGTQRAMLHGSYRANVAHGTDFYRRGERIVREAETEYDQLREIRRTHPLKTALPEESRLSAKVAKDVRAADRNFALAQGFYENVPAPYRLKHDVVDGFRAIMRDRIDFALYRDDYSRAEEWLEYLNEFMSERGFRPTPEMRKWMEESEERIEGLGTLRLSGGAGVREVLPIPLVESPGKPFFETAEPLGRKSLPATFSNLPPRSYVLMIVRTDGTLMPWPVYVGHGERVSLHIDLPKTIPAGMAFVPGGTFFCGGDDSRFYRKHVESLPPFFIKQTEVTVGEYLEFWKSLVDSKRKDRFMSRLRFHQKERSFVDAWDAQGRLADDRLRLDYPVVGITLEAAKAFCEWKSRETGALVRLPTAMEWEKAARGTDGRRFVWGNGLDVRLALTRENKEAKATYPYWAPPKSFPRDLSVYNVFDMAGNVREMTSSPFPDDAGFFQVRGASASTPSAFLPCAHVSDTPVAPSDVGFRYVMEMPR